VVSTIRLEEEGKWIPVIRLKIVEVLRTKPSVAAHLSLDPAWVIQACRSAGNRSFPSSPDVAAVVGCHDAQSEGEM
jgi:hypothetical protein